jgi:hypothetical protein
MADSLNPGWESLMTRRELLAPMASDVDVWIRAEWPRLAAAATTAPDASGTHRASRIGEGKRRVITCRK